MWFIMINEDFECENCWKKIEKNKNWWVRNHCPHCLYSKHLDDKKPWDRLSTCLWLLKPVGIDFRKNKWYCISYKCIKCWNENINKVSEDDNFLDFVKKINSKK